MSWTTSGSVRGWCGHWHRTRGGAERCLARDRRGCRAQGGYSDRDLLLVVRDGETDGVDLFVPVDEATGEPDHSRARIAL